MHSGHGALLFAPSVLLLIVAGCSSDSREPGPAAESSSGWRTVYSSDDWWMNVYAPASNDRWIVGGTPDEGKIVHYDGTDFAVIDHGTDVELLNWIHGFESGELITVGNGGAVVRGDGATWAQVSVPTSQDLWGVWGATPADIWVVGGDPEAGGVPVVLRDTGGGFEAVTIPSLERPRVRAFFKVWGSRPDDVYIVGQNGAVLHWDGESLLELNVGVGKDLITVWGTGPDRVAVIGGRTNGAGALWDGARWSVLDLARFPGMNGVWLRGDTVHVVGNNGTGGVISFATGEVTRVAIDTPIYLHAINGSPDGTLTAVGGNYFAGEKGPFSGEILVRTLESWE